MWCNRVMSLLAYLLIVIHSNLFVQLDVSDRRLMRAASLYMTFKMSSMSIVKWIPERIFCTDIPNGWKIMLYLICYMLYMLYVYLIPKVLDEFYQRLQIPTNFCLVLQGYLFMTLNLIQSHYISNNGSEIHIISRFADGPWCCCCKFNYLFEMWSAWYYQKTCMVKTIFPCLLFLWLVMGMGSEALCCHPKKYIHSTCIWFLILKTEG